MNLAIQPFSHFSASVARVRRYKNLIITITITITLEQDSEGGIAQLAPSPRLLMMMLMY